MRKLNWIHILLSITTILLLIDILTGIFYWNRMNLIFSSIEFNNIITPIAGIAAIIIYYLALQTSQKQNKTINSFQHKEIFIKEIQKLIKEGEQIEVKFDNYYTVNFIKFEETITNILMKELRYNNDYNVDNIKYEDISDEDMIEKTYFHQMHFINTFILKYKLSHCYNNRVKDFIEKVVNSELIDNHKKEILVEIENELITDYLRLINNIKSFSKFSSKSIPLAITMTDFPKPKYKWISILDTELIDFYNWYQKKRNNYA